MFINRLTFCNQGPPHRFVRNLLETINICPKYMSEVLVHQNHDCEIFRTFVIKLPLGRGILWSTFPLDTGGKLNVHKTFRRHPGRLLNSFVRSIYAVYLRLGHVKLGISSFYNFLFSNLVSRFFSRLLLF